MKEVHGRLLCLRAPAPCGSPCPRRPLWRHVENHLRDSAEGTRVSHRWEVESMNLQFGALMPVLCPLIELSSQRDLEDTIA